jgi:choline-sulfatase
MNGSLGVSTPPHPKAVATVANRPGANGFSHLLASGMRAWSGNSKLWSHKNGVLTGKSDGTLKMNHFITWKVATVRNFDLKVKVRISAGGNSGIQYRSDHAPHLGLDVVTGYQCDVVADKPQFNGMVYEEKGRGILSRTSDKVVVDPKGERWVVGKFEVKEFAPSEWHEYRILVEGNRHRHWIDGHPTGDLIDLDEKSRALDGVLALQLHRGPPMTIEFKDMLIKHLPDDLPLLQLKDRPIPAEAIGAPPRGKLPKDWKPPVYGER